MLRVQRLGDTYVSPLYIVLSMLRSLYGRVS